MSKQELTVVGSLTRALVDFLGRPIGRDDRERAAWHVLDWIGCAAAGAGTAPGRAIQAFAAGLPPGKCHAVGGFTLASRDAALVNGALGNVLEMDDFYRDALVHPGPVVIPAALAAAEDVGASGDAMLNAVVRGYEVMIRIGRSVGPTHYRYFHNTATCGAFGAAAAVASLLGLDSEATVHALGNAGTQASGLWQCRLEDVMTKQLHNGRAAQSGMLAAQLAAHGFTGVHAILEGPLGFYTALCPDASPQLLLDAPEAPWAIHGTSFKPWPACRHVHAAIDSALAVRENLDASTIANIVVASYRDALSVCDNRDPRTPVQAKFSLQHAVAIALLRGPPKLPDFEASQIHSPDVVALRAKVHVQEDAALSAAYPGRFGAALHVQLGDGSLLTRSVSDALGDPENPMSPDDLTDKARMLLRASGYCDPDIEGIMLASLGLCGAPSVQALTRRIL